MAKLTMNELHDEPRRLPGLARWARIAYLLCAGLFAACVVVQVFFAGAGALAGSSYWSAHRGFGQAIQWLTVAMLVVGFFGRLPRRMHGQNVILLVLFVLQYIFLWVMPQIGLPVLRALHAVNALGIFSLAMYLTRQAWQLARAA